MKKTNERRFFDLVYSQLQPSEVIPSESPDFICHVGGVPVLGVEITELFRNEGYARLKKIPGYTLQLIKSKAYKHKYDKQYIKVEKAQIRNSDGTFNKEIQGIFHPGVTAHEAVTCLNSLINKKCNKAPDYLKLAPEIDLVIHDASELFSAEVQLIFGSLSLFLDRSIITSPFREIFLLITKRDKSAVKLPLKLALFLEDAFIFEKLIREDTTLKKQRPNAFYLLFYCLQEKGYGSYKTIIESDSISVVVGAHEYIYTVDDKYINEVPLGYNIPEKIHKTVSECIMDKDDQIVKIGQRYLDERKTLNCFIDVFSNCVKSNKERGAEKWKFEI